MQRVDALDGIEKSEHFPVVRPISSDVVKEHPRPAVGRHPGAECHNYPTGSMRRGTVRPHRRDPAALLDGSSRPTGKRCTSARTSTFACRRERPKRRLGRCRRAAPRPTRPRFWALLRDACGTRRPSSGLSPPRLPSRHHHELLATSSRQGRTQGTFGSPLRTCDPSAPARPRKGAAPHMNRLQRLLLRQVIVGRVHPSLRADGGHRRELRHRRLTDQALGLVRPSRAKSRESEDRWSSEWLNASIECSF